jgi:hypothetical protein
MVCNSEKSQHVSCDSGNDNLSALVFIYHVTGATTTIQTLLADGWMCCGDNNGLFFAHPEVTSEKDMCERIKGLGLGSDGGMLVYDLAYLEWSIMHEREWYTLSSFRDALNCFGLKSAFSDDAEFWQYDHDMSCGVEETE